MELAVLPQQSSSGEVEQLDLYISLSFNEQWEPLNGGGVKFGLTGGQLRLRLENSKLIGSSVDKSDFRAILLTESTAEQPVWMVASKEDVILKGTCDRRKFASLKLLGQPARLEATFEVSLADIQLTASEGVWLHQISPNQLAVVERKVAIAIFQSRLTPYLSQVVWMADPQPEPQKPTQVQPNYAQLLSELQPVLTAKTHNFLELAKLGGLNPLEDFAGSKMLGVDLKSLDLSGANLHRTYLRGSVLSDIDFSNADLSQANLGGADLSGAYLSDANLVGANLHRASLALANLSGADLRDADLSYANLQNANLSDTNLQGANLSHADLTRAGLVLTTLSEAKVENARFKDNSGISEDIKRELQERGAIFEN